MQDNDSIWYVGISGAAEGLGENPAKIRRVIADGFLAGKTRRGGSTPRGGRPATLIPRQELIAAIGRYDAWEKRNEREKPRKSRPVAPPPPAPRRTLMTKKRRKSMRRLRRGFHPSRPRPRGYSRNRLRR